jgi:predicted ATPase/DNA-binding SARP family transcriptional activator
MVQRHGLIGLFAYFFHSGSSVFEARQPNDSTASGMLRISPDDCIIYKFDKNALDKCILAHLEIDVLGPLEVILGDTPVTNLESVKVRALLAYLAVESDRPHTRASLVGLLWPEYPEESARHNLRQALFNLRVTLGDQKAAPPYFQVSRDVIQINHESDYSLDLDQFNRYFSDCPENLPRCIEDCATHAANLEKMVKLYRGEFLQHLYVDDSSEFEEWIVVQRENLHQRILEVHGYLARYYELHADYRAARQHAGRQLELDPWREEAHRQMMRVLTLDGQRSAALAQYDTCKRVLAEALDVEPSLETRELYEQIRQGAFSADTPQLNRTPVTPLIFLPTQPTPFVGREIELYQLGQYIQDPECRCLTLLGPGGIGKTRLALQVAESHLGRFAQGAAFVSLASVGSAAGIVPAIANAINFTFFGPGDPKAFLLANMREKQILLILDNVEHLLINDAHQENIAQIIVEILSSAPKIKILVTSREALNLQEELIYEVRGLPYPETRQAEKLDNFDAVTLFVQRARRAFPGFTLSCENQFDIARICRLVEGMPLAIELAATWMRILTPAEIAHEIENSLDFLNAPVRDLPERHRSMRAVFDHSWQLLSPDEQQVLSKLSVFRGGFQRQAAEQVAGATLSILSTLVNRTLLRRTTGGRYDLHELIRQYSADHLASQPALKSATQQRHFDFYLEFAQTANQELQRRDQINWLGRLEQERNNLRIALEWALDNDVRFADGYEPGLRLAAALRWFWRMRGYFHEGNDWLTEALQHYPVQRSEPRASALLAKSLLVNALGDLIAALPLAEESMAIYRELEDQQGLAEALMIGGLTSLWQGEADQGREWTKQALEIYRQLGDLWGEAQALYRLGSYLADYSGALEGRAMLEESATILENFDEKYLYTSVLVSLGIVDMKIGDFAAAQVRFELGLYASREIRHPWGLADVLTNLGCLHRIRGDYHQAQVCFDEALGVYREHGYNMWQIDVLCAMTENAIAQGNFTSAHIHLQAADSLIDTSNNHILEMLLRYFRGLLAYYEGENERAVALLEDTAEEARKGQFLSDLARAQVTLGLVRLNQERQSLAIPSIQEGLRIYWEISQKTGCAAALEALAFVFMAQGREADALRLFGVGDTLRKALGAPIPLVDRPAYQAAIAACRRKLGIANYIDLWERAAAQQLDEVVVEVLKDV